jgi:tetratricopeptide (TPR) repeat protein
MEERRKEINRYKLWLSFVFILTNNIYGQDCRDKVTSLIENGAKNEAKKELKTCLVEDPGNFELLYLKARIYVIEEKYEKSYLLYSMIINQTTNRTLKSKCLVDRSLILYFQSNLDKGKYDLIKALEYDSTNINALLTLPKICYELGDYQLAIMYTRLLERDTNYIGEYLSYLGENMIMLNNYSSAKECYNQLMKQSRYKYYCLLKLGEIALYEKKFDSSLHYLNLTEPFIDYAYFPDLHSAKGEVLYCQERYFDSHVELEKAIYYSRELDLEITYDKILLAKSVIYLYAKRDDYKYCKMLKSVMKNLNLIRSDDQWYNEAMTLRALVKLIQDKDKDVLKILNDTELTNNQLIIKIIAGDKVDDTNNQMFTEEDYEFNFLISPIDGLLWNR